MWSAEECMSFLLANLRLPTNQQQQLPMKIRYVSCRVVSLLLLLLLLLSWGRSVSRVRPRGNTHLSLFCCCCLEISSSRILRCIWGMTVEGRQTFRRRRRRRTHLCAYTFLRSFILDSGRCCCFVSHKTAGRARQGKAGQSKAIR